jgi:hypothetical protein
MKRFFLFAAFGFTLALFAACGSDDDAMHDHMEGDMGEHMESDMGDNMEGAESMGMNEGMTGDESWVRSEPVDVKSVDGDGDGYVYQDQMDWNVIADQEGKCPKCGMTLKKVTVEEAEQNLKDHDFEVADNG